MSDSTWDFPAGTVCHDRSLKGYRAETTDGAAGEVSWCDYAPGESYLVVTRHPHLGGRNHVVPAGAVASVDHAQRVVRLDITQGELDSLPPVDEPATEIDWDYVNRFEIGWLQGSGVPLPDPDS